MSIDFSQRFNTDEMTTIIIAKETIVGGGGTRGMNHWRTRSNRGTPSFFFSHNSLETFPLLPITHTNSTGNSFSSAIDSAERRANSGLWEGKRLPISYAFSEEFESSWKKEWLLAGGHKNHCCRPPGIEGKTRMRRTISYGKTHIYGSSSNVKKEFGIHKENQQQQKSKWKKSVFHLKKRPSFHFRSGSHFLNIRISFCVFRLFCPFLFPVRSESLPFGRIKGCPNVSRSVAWWIRAKEDFSNATMACLN